MLSKPKTNQLNLMSQILRKLSKKIKILNKLTKEKYKSGHGVEINEIQKAEEVRAQIDQQSQINFGKTKFQRQ